ncbi:MAG: ATP-dependent DNA helicase RecG, partial [Halioglobus sp.]
MGSAIADSIEPFFTPNIQLVTWRKRDLLIINVPHSIGPYYLKSKGEVNSTFIRLGSTNRLADGMMIENIKRLKQHLYYDELPCTEAVKEDLAKNLLSTGSKKFSTQTAKSLELLVKHQDSFFPSLGGMLLFGNIEKKQELYPHIVIRCARFHGKTKTKINDPLDIYLQLPLAVDAVLDYVKKHSINSYEIKGSRGKETPLYPPTAVREAVVNSLVHADYSVKGASIQVAL